jgi:hypothetical protein
MGYLEKVDNNIQLENNKVTVQCIIGLIRVIICNNKCNNKSGTSTNNL